MTVQTWIADQVCNDREGSCHPGLDPGSISNEGINAESWIADQVRNDKILSFIPRTMTDFYFLFPTL